MARWRANKRWARRRPGEQGTTRERWRDAHDVAVCPLSEPLDAVLEAVEHADEAAADELEEAASISCDPIRDDLARVVDGLEDGHDERAEGDRAQIVGARALEAGHRDRLAAGDVALVDRVRVEVPAADHVACGQMRDIDEDLMAPPSDDKHSEEHADPRAKREAVIHTARRKDIGLHVSTEPHDPPHHGEDRHAAGDEHGSRAHCEHARDEREHLCGEPEALPDADEP